MSALPMVGMHLVTTAYAGFTTVTTTMALTSAETSSNEPKLHRPA